MHNPPMRCLVYTCPGEIGIEERDRPVLLDRRDAIIKVTMASICTSDLHIIGGNVPKALPGIVLGHEFVGVVEETGDLVSNVKPGDRVAVNCETFCGCCYFCRHGWVNNCTDAHGGWNLGCVSDGGQAEYARIPYADNALTPIPERVSDQAALLTGDLLSTGYWAADIGGISEGDVVAVIGAGPTGACCSMMARARGAGRIAMLDPDSGRLDFALEHGYADAVCDPSREDPVAFIEGLTGGRGADVVIETGGTSESFRSSWMIARPNATVVIVAMYGSPQTLPLPDMYGKNLVFKTGGVDACHCGEIMDMIADGRIDARPLITHTMPFSEVEKAYRIFSERLDGVMKVALQMDNNVHQ